MEDSSRSSSGQRPKAIRSIATAAVANYPPHKLATQIMQAFEASATADAVKLMDVRRKPFRLVAARCRVNSGKPQTVWLWAIPIQASQEEGATTIPQGSTPEVEVHGGTANRSDDIV